MIGVVLVIVLAICLALYLLFDRYCRRALGENPSRTGTAAGMLAVCGICPGSGRISPHENDRAKANGV